MKIITLPTISTNTDFLEFTHLGIHVVNQKTILTDDVDVLRNLSHTTYLPKIFPIQPNQQIYLNHSKKNFFIGFLSFVLQDSYFWVLWTEIWLFIQ